MNVINCVLDSEEQRVNTLIRTIRQRGGDYGIVCSMLSTCGHVLNAIKNVRERLEDVPAGKSSSESRKLAESVLDGLMTEDITDEQFEYRNIRYLMNRRPT